MSGPDPSNPVLVHFYRALVGHMDVWRQRMDATTNWAAATTAAMVTFSFSAPESPHFVLILAAAFNATFLLMESRRYQIFDLWRRRFRALNQFYIAPALTGRPMENERAAAAFESVAADLGRLVPHLPITKAIGYRIRRNYGYLFLVNGVAWLLKLEVHPTTAGTVGELVERAAVGVIPGEVVVIAFLGWMGLMLALALGAPSEQMMNWADVPAPLVRWREAWTRTMWRRPRDSGGRPE